jgi:hypothetical protein
MTNFWNSNGLVKGKIPKGTGCPFYAKCNTTLVKSLRCPTTEAPFDNDFSCAFARGMSLVAERMK